MATECYRRLYKAIFIIGIAGITVVIDSFLTNHSQNVKNMVDKI